LAYYADVSGDMVVVQGDMVVVQGDMVVVQVDMVVVQVDIVVVQGDRILADPYTLYRFLKTPQLKIYVPLPKGRIQRQIGIP